MLQAERRTVPGESLDQVEAELQGLLDRLQRDDPRLQGRRGAMVAARQPVRGRRGRGDRRGSCGRTPARASRSARRYWTDSALIAEPLIPTVLFGPGGEGAHAQVEWVSVADVERCAAVFLSVATEFCA